MGYFLDIRFILLVTLPSLILSGLASLMVKSAFAKYSQVRTRRGYTGAQAARILLDNYGLHDV